MSLIWFPWVAFGDPTAIVDACVSMMTAEVASAAMHSDPVAAVAAAAAAAAVTAIVTSSPDATLTTDAAADVDTSLRDCC